MMYEYMLGGWQVWIPPVVIDVGDIAASFVHRDGGAFSVIDWPCGQDLYSLYGRSNLALKCFKNPVVPLSDFLWGKPSQASLVEATVIQNLFALDDLAPRVYGIVLLEGKQRQWWAQVTDWAPMLPLREHGGGYKAADARERGRWRVTACSDPNPKNWINGRLVDFQPYRFEDLSILCAEVLERAAKPCAWGSRPEIYQDIPEWNVVGQRDSVRRTRELGLEEMDFTGKSVLDVGCNVGTMSRLAARLGASRVVGLDSPACARIASEISALLGYWNLDFHGCNLNSVDPREMDGIDDEFDIVLYLSQFKFPAWAHEMCSNTMLFEGHVGQHRATFEDQLLEHFETVEYRGKTRDHGPRPYFVCRKGDVG